MSNNPFHVAVDDGYAQTKLYGEDPKTREPIRAIMRSSIRPGKEGLANFNGGGRALYLTEEGEHFTVSNAIESESTQFDGFHTSSLNRVLVNHALLEAGYSGQKVNLITGLPVADYFFDEERDYERIDAKRDNLMRGVEAVGGQPMPIIQDANVGCQAVAALFDYLLDDDLNQVRDFDGGVAIVDIGGRTTDVAVVYDGEAIDHSTSGTENIGVLDVYKALDRAIRRHFRIRESFTLDQLDLAVRSKKINLWNQERSIAELVDSVVLEQEQKIARSIERRIGSAVRLNAVVFVGGGSALFKSIAKQFPNGHMPDDPEFSNAKGLFKHSKLKDA